jgi:hypothetical protein
MKGEQMSDDLGNLTERCGSVPQAPLRSPSVELVMRAAEALVHANVKHVQSVRAVGPFNSTECRAAYIALQQEVQCLADVLDAQDRQITRLTTEFETTNKWRETWKARFKALEGNNTKKHHDKMSAKLAKATERIAELERELMAIQSRRAAHTEHPSRHWDRTCPACQQEAAE